MRLSPLHTADRDEFALMCYLALGGALMTIVASAVYLYALAQ